MGILVLTTGGTIGALPYSDPQHPPEFSSMPRDGQDIVRNEVDTTFASFNARCLSLEPRDSKLIDESYRKNILTIIESSLEDLILITHGTDTILQTAHYFYQRFTDNAALGNKTVLITGAMIPLANGPESDGYRNMAYALECLRDDVCRDSHINIVLSDFDDAGVWAPRLYPFQPDLYEKFYDTDQRYNRLRPKLKTEA